MPVIISEKSCEYSFWRRVVTMNFLKEEELFPNYVLWYKVFSEIGENFWLYHQQEYVDFASFSFTNN